MPPTRGTPAGAPRLPGIFDHTDPQMGHESYHLRGTPQLGHRHCLASLTRQKRERERGKCHLREGPLREKLPKTRSGPPLVPQWCVHFRCGNILPPREKLSKTRSVPPQVRAGCVHFRCGNILPAREKLSETTSSALVGRACRGRTRARPPARAPASAGPRPWGSQSPRRAAPCGRGSSPGRPKPFFLGILIHCLPRGTAGFRNGLPRILGI